jgi:hypothetical protein
MQALSNLSARRSVRSGSRGENVDDAAGADRPSATAILERLGLSGPRTANGRVRPWAARQSHDVRRSMPPPNGVEVRCRLGALTPIFDFTPDEGGVPQCRGLRPRRLAFQRRRHPCGGARRNRTARMAPSRCRRLSNCVSGGERNPCRPAALSKKAEGFAHRMADHKCCRSQEAERRLGVKGVGTAVVYSYSRRAREYSSYWRVGSNIV